MGRLSGPLVVWSGSSAGFWLGLEDFFDFIIDVTSTAFA